MQRPLIINGFMAAGKTTAARLVAERTGHPWVDLDHEVERTTGKSVAELFESEGEVRFRSLEQEALGTALQRTDAPVISVGGGALVPRAARLAAMRRGVVVWLRAKPETLLRRVGSGDDRPLLAGRDAPSLLRLLELREPAYQEAHDIVDCDELPPSEVAARLHGIWQRDPLGVAAGAHSYSVEVGQGHFEGRLSACLRGATLGFLVTDRNVDALYGAAARRAIETVTVGSGFVMTPGEEHKTPATLTAIWEAALQAGADRKSVVVGLGGGVATDVAGFAAATWMRGVPWVSIPTNLQGMVDASVGGKTAVDLTGAKNCVGAFWQPLRVLCDVSHLGTESERGFRGALAEVVKTALIGDAPLLSLVERESAGILAREPALLESLVRRCIAVKAAIVSEDEREGGQRAALNLGHTLGHALEAHGGYGHLTHGEAVSLGLVAALRIGERLGRGSREHTARVVDLLAAFGLPTDLSRHPVLEATQLLTNDKKRTGSAIRFVLSPEPGQVEFRSIELGELRELAATSVRP